MPETQTPMGYRPFGREKKLVSQLGFGCMRLPQANGSIDRQEAARCVHWAIDHGVNYLDTAYPYHGGDSETFVGEVTQGTIRDKVLIATKLPVWKVQEKADIQTIFDEQRSKLHTDFIDVYMLHAVNHGSWTKMRDMGIQQWLRDQQGSGNLGDVGFSFHGPLADFQKIVDEFTEANFCQIQYNIVNEDVQAGTEGLNYAAKKGLSLIIMEPLLGGSLCVPPPKVKALYEESGLNPVEEALRWIWNKPEVSLLLSGMSTFEQVTQNVELASSSPAGCLSEMEAGIIQRVQKTYKELKAIPCTACGYCVPCPQGVKIPQNFGMYNDIEIYGETRIRPNQNRYAKMADEERASSCIACGECEELCPQDIPISDWMPKVDRRLSGS